MDQVLMRLKAVAYALERMLSDSPEEFVENFSKFVDANPGGDWLSLAVGKAMLAFHEKRYAILKAERDALIANWPQYVEGLEWIPNVINCHAEGDWSVLLAGAVSEGYSTREEAVLAAIASKGAV